MRKQQTANSKQQTVQERAGSRGWCGPGASPGRCWSCAAASARAPSHLHRAHSDPPPVITNHGPEQASQHSSKQIRSLQDPTVQPLSTKDKEAVRRTLVEANLVRGRAGPVVFVESDDGSRAVAVHRDPTTHQHRAVPATHHRTQQSSPQGNGGVQLYGATVASNG